jgi:nucleotide-binding universal stress UspA family protein
VPYKKILVGTDGSETASRAVEQAAVLAKANDSELLVLTVFDPPSPTKLAQQQAEAPEEIAWRITSSGAAEEVADRAITGLGADVKASPLVEPSHDPADALIHVADREGADLIIVGNRGMTGAKRFLLGSVPNKVSHHAPCDVMIVRTS